MHSDVMTGRFVHDEHQFSLPSNIHLTYEAQWKVSTFGKPQIKPQLNCNIQIKHLGELQFVSSS